MKTALAIASILVFSSAVEAAGDVEAEIRELTRRVNSLSKSDPAQAEALFALAAAHQRAADASAATKAGQRRAAKHASLAHAIHESIVRLHPKSAHAGPSRLAIGHHALAQKKFQNALESFFKCARRARANNASLAAACRDGFVLAYAEVGKAQKAHVAFKRVSKPDAVEMVAKLADLYDATGKAPKAIFSYRSLLRLLPKDPRACVWQGQVLRLVIAIGAQKQIAPERRRLIALGKANNDVRCADLARGL